MTQVFTGREFRRPSFHLRAALGGQLGKHLFRISCKPCARAGNSRSNSTWKSAVQLTARIVGVKLFNPFTE